mgnify:CR=1 FL=1
MSDRRNGAWKCGNSDAGPCFMGTYKKERVRMAGRKDLGIRRVVVSGGDRKLDGYQGS